MHLCKLYICKEQLNKYINIKSIIPTTVFIEGPLYLRVLTPLNLNLIYIYLLRKTFGENQEVYVYVDFLVKLSVKDTLMIDVHL